MIQAVDTGKVKGASYYKYKEYVELARKTMKPEHIDLRNAYRELNRGNNLVDLTIILRNGGVLPSGMPKLAVARIDAAKCKCYYYEGSKVEFHSISKQGFYIYARNEAEVKYHGVLPQYGDVKRNWSRHGYTPMPYIPEEAYRIAKNHHKVYKPEQWFILWEVAKWDNVSSVDPYLLRRVTDTLFVNEHQWDVTPVEAAIMQGKIHSL